MPREATLIIVLVLTLVLCGIVMVYSACSVNAKLEGFPLKHLCYAGAGLLTMFIAMRFDYHRLRDPLLFRWIVLATIVLLVLVFVPGLGVAAKGAQRWLSFGPLHFQPSELAKFAMVLLLAVKLTDNREYIQEFFRGFVPALFIFGLFAGLVLLEKDLGVPAVMAGVAFAMICVAGVRWRYILLSIVPVAAAMWYLIKMEPHRVMRLAYFLDPWPYREEFGGSYQLIQALAAFAQGGILGRGAGASEQKLGYLPEGHNDFVFALVGEEFGLIGTLFVLTLFAVLLIASLRISMYAADRFGSLLAMGVTMLIGLQAAMVMAVTTGIAPTKGMSLPFISYGGTALIVFMGMAGILVNIAAQAPEPESARKSALATA